MTSFTIKAKDEIWYSAVSSKNAKKKSLEKTRRMKDHLCITSATRSFNEHFTSPGTFEMSVSINCGKSVGF